MGILFHFCVSQDMLACKKAFYDKSKSPKLSPKPRRIGSGHDRELMTIIRPLHRCLRGSRHIIAEGEAEYKLEMLQYVATGANALPIPYRH